MSKNDLLSSSPRLANLIEVEVYDASDPTETHIHGLHGLSDDPLKALEELAEKMEQLELTANRPLSTSSTRERDEAAKAISEMQKRLEHFQRQSAVLKRLLNKLH
jgi:hypothetical protein